MCVIQTVCHGDVECHTIEKRPVGKRLFDRQRRFFHSSQAGDWCHMQIGHWQLASRDDLVRGSQGGFHDSARIGEDIGRS